MKNWITAFVTACMFHLCSGTYLVLNWWVLYHPSSTSYITLNLLCIMKVCQLCLSPHPASPFICHLLWCLILFFSCPLISLKGCKTGNWLLITIYSRMNICCGQSSLTHFQVSCFSGSWYWGQDRPFDQDTWQMPVIFTASKSGAFQPKSIMHDVFLSSLHKYMSWSLTHFRPLTGNWSLYMLKMRKGSSLLSSVWWNIKHTFCKHVISFYWFS